MSGAGARSGAADEERTAGETMSDQHDDMSELRDEIDGVGQAAAKRFDPGPGALVIAVCVLVVLVSMLLPWLEEHTGFEVLVTSAPIVPRVFAVIAVVGGVLLSALTLVLRRWALAWVSGLACFAGSVVGVLSIWTTQTTNGHEPGPGPGGGLIAAVVAVVLLLVRWLKVAVSRPGFPEPERA
ncbi:Rv2732c family membrane protein [Actinosynnema sp.]|uniref:Rv2732c family membrane protein n=1 Tax=Actinosynnema sp. TaxID=1872144 RepID=UPI003F82A07D